jgi:acyl carrier protein
VGIRYWEALLQSDQAQGIALYGDPSKLEAYLAHGVSHEPPSVRPETGKADAQSLREAAESYLKTLLSEEIKLPADRIDAEERFDAFGVDSMMISRINDNLERDLGGLPKTLFYEYATIEELAGYLVREASPALVRCLGVPAAAESRVEQDVPAPSARIESAPIRSASEEVEAVAIIGCTVSRAPSPRGVLAQPEGRQGPHRPGAGEPLESRRISDPDPANASRARSIVAGRLPDDASCRRGVLRRHAGRCAHDRSPERLFIQSVWAAIEDAGYKGQPEEAPPGQSADVGVFVGVTTNTYHLDFEEWNRVTWSRPVRCPGPSPIACRTSSISRAPACRSTPRARRRWSRSI